MTFKTQPKMSSAGADRDPLASGLRPRDHVVTALLVALVLLAVWMLVSMAVGIFSRSSWSLEPQRHPYETQRRVETSAVSWVGPGEDRYGVNSGGDGYLRLHLARHCDGEWSVTYPTGTTALPPPGSPVMVEIASEGGGTVDIVGTVAANSTTVSLMPTTELDEVMFVDGELILRVKAGDRPLSLTKTRLRSYRPKLWPTSWANPASHIRGEVFDPLKHLEDACAAV